MKAYMLTIKDAEDAGGQIVFANTSREAKKMMHGDLYDQLENYTDIRVHRDKRYDDMENLSEAELALKQWHDGWVFNDMDSPQPEEASDDEFIEWYKENF